MTKYFTVTLTRFKNNNNLTLLFPRKVKYEHSFYYNCIKIWNCLPEASLIIYYQNVLLIIYYQNVLLIIYY